MTHPGVGIIIGNRTREKAYRTIRISFSVTKPRSTSNLRLRSLLSYLALLSSAHWRVFETIERNIEEEMVRLPFSTGLGEPLGFGLWTR